MAHPQPEFNRLVPADVWRVLALGWRDFRAAPRFGLFFGGVYALGGLVLVLAGAGAVVWTLALSLGFPLIAPFAAVGLYDVSRRLETGAPLDWRGVLASVWAQRGKQIPWIGGLIMVYFLFWTFLAHMLFALFLGLTPGASMGDGMAFLFTANGAVLLIVEFAVGGVLALLLFALTCLSLPMLLERDLDFVTAMLVSGSFVVRNAPVMALWAFIIGGLTLLGMVPLFLGLCVALPVLGHGTWHLYRRALVWPDAPQR